MDMINECFHSGHQDIAWSTESVLASTVERIQSCKLSLAPIEMLPKLRDVDVIEVCAPWKLLIVYVT